MPGKPSKLEALWPPIWETARWMERLPWFGLIMVILASSAIWWGTQQGCLYSIDERPKRIMQYNSKSLRYHMFIGYPISLSPWGREFCSIYVAWLWSNGRILSFYLQGQPFYPCMLLPVDFFSLPQFTYLVSDFIFFIRISLPLHLCWKLSQQFLSLSDISYIIFESALASSG